MSGNDTTQRTAADTMATRTVNRLVTAGLWYEAWRGTVSICAWLNHEQHYGRPARRRRLAADLANWTARRDEYNPLAAAVSR